MAKMKIDWKQLFVEKGERIALGVAGFLCALMVLPMLWYMVSGQNSKEIVKGLTEPAEALSSKQKSSKPDTSDLPPETPKDGSPIIVARATIDNPLDFQVPQLFTPVVHEDSTKRRMPSVFLPSEGTGTVVFAQVERYILLGKAGDDKEQIMILRGGGVGGGDTPGAKPMPDAGPRGQPRQPNYRNLGTLYGARGRGGPGGMPPGGMGDAAVGGRRPMYQQPPDGYDVDPSQRGPRRDLKAEVRPVEALLNLQADEHPADTVEPVRMAIIAASFPYRRQLEEFKNKLKLDSLYSVWAETVDLSTDKNDPKEEPAFRFLLPIVQRREVDSNGQPVPLGNGTKTSDWETIPIEASYRELVRANGKRFEDDSEKLMDVSFKGLAMNKLAVIPGVKNPYPDELKMGLKDLNETIAELERQNSPSITKPKNPLKVEDDFDPTDRPSATDLRTPMGAEPGVKGRTGMPPVRTPGTDPTVNDSSFPEYCLVRLIDVTIQPGKIYQYRIKMRMANPNYGKTAEVASPNYATQKEPLVSSQWFEIKKQGETSPHSVVVPPEYHLYGLDQMAVDMAEQKTYRGQHFDKRLKEHQVAFQIQKWVEGTAPDSRSAMLPIGEWLVAERVLVYRGEYINRTQRVEVPYWRHTMESFVMAVDSTVKGVARNQLRGIEVDFSPPGVDNQKEDPILVDYEGGDVKYQRVTGKDEKGADKTVTVNERTGHESLILSPDGKLLEHDSWTDRRDPERVKILDAWRQRLLDVKSGKGSGPMPNNPMRVPFGKDT